MEKLNYQPKDEFLSRISAEERIGWAKPDYKVTISDVELKSDLPKWVRGEKQVRAFIPIAAVNVCCIKGSAVFLVFRGES